ncbi:MAG: hypothetical protein M3068_00130 [Gemmatimonadota bacterium]|nr:hypothetical protein [Gemmatimonadota bacterium]
MTLRRLSIVVTSTALVLTATLDSRIVMGQAAGAGSRSPSPTGYASDLCWRGHPEPRCHLFWITEFASEHPIATTSTRSVYQSGFDPQFINPDFTWRIVWTVGPMVNVAPRSAVGGAFLLGPTEFGSRMGAEARYRRWLDGNNAVDFSAGLIRMDVRRAMTPPDRERASGLTAAVALGSGDMIGVTGRVDVLRDQGRARVGSFAGVRLGSYAAVGATAVLAAAFLLFVAAFKGGDHPI